MSRGPGPEQRLSPTERANLVAYLDGELPEPESRSIATKLTLSPTARREVEALEKTWQLLDHLSQVTASEDFAERTLTGVRRLDERGGEIQSALLAAVRRVGWVTLWATGATVAFGFGYAASARFWPNPSARLARDLAIAEHLDEYQDVSTFQLLQELANSPEFLSESDE